MLGSKRLDEKHEKIIRALLRTGENKRCIDCESIGPQYVLTTFNVFVCMTCSGIHRQFGHRVKGVSMSTFTPEEVAALQAGGNQKFLATYCAKWMPSSLPRPTDRSPQRLKEWIEGVYISKRFYEEPSEEDVRSLQGGDAASETASIASIGKHSVRSVAASADATNDVTIVSMADVLGPSAPRLHITSSPSTAATTTAAAPSSQTHGGAATTVSDDDTRIHVTALTQSSTSTQTKDIAPQEQQPAAAGAGGVTVSHPSAVALSNTQPQQHVVDWDPFGDASTAPMPEAVSSSSAGGAPAVETPSVAPSQPPQTASSTSDGDAITAELAGLALGSTPAVEKDTEDAVIHDVVEWQAFPQAIQVVIEDMTGETNTPVGQLPSAAPTWLHDDNTTGAAGDENSEMTWEAFDGNGTANAAPGVAAKSPSRTAHAGNSRGPAEKAHAAPPGNILAQSALSNAASNGADMNKAPPRREVPLDIFFPEFERIRATGQLPTGQYVPHHILAADLQANAVTHLHSSHGAAFAPMPTGPINFGTIFAPNTTYHIAGGRSTTTSSASSHQGDLSDATPSWPSAQNVPHRVASAPTYNTAVPTYNALESSAVRVVTSASPQLHAASPPPPQPSSVGVTPPAAASIDAVWLPGSQSIGYNSLSREGEMIVEAEASHVDQASTPQRSSPNLIPAHAAAASATLFGVNTALGAYDLSAPAAPQPRATGNPFA